MPTEYTNTVRLPEAERREILARLERENTPELERLRGATRWSFREVCVHIVVEHPSGGFSRIEVLAKDLSETGMAVLHGGFLYPGSECQVVLRRRDGAEETLLAYVVRCRHVTGRIHEVGMRFRTSVNPTTFVKLDAPAPGGDDDEIQLAALRGRVLYLDDSEVDQQLVAHHLTGSGIELTPASSPSQAMEAVKAKTFDIVMCDVSLGSDDGVAAIRDIRQEGFPGPIVLVTAETSDERIGAAMEAGATHQLAKPFTKDRLIDMMSVLHRETGRVLPAEAPYSRLEREPGMLALIQVFVDSARKLARRMEAAIAADDFDAVRDICLTVWGSAESYGFIHLNTCAGGAVKALDATSSISRSLGSLRKLILFCDSVTVRTAGAA